MKKDYLSYFKLITLAAALPFIYGCGGGSGSLIGFLFGSGGGGISGSEITLLSAPGGFGGALGGGAGLASLHSPEPASMLLLGSGLAAMTYFKSKSNRRNKSAIK